MKYETEEERLAAKREGMRKLRSKAPVRLELDGDLIKDIDRLGEKMEIAFGFRPTVSQTIRYLLKIYGTEAPGVIKGSEAP